MDMLGENEFIATFYAILYIRFTKKWCNLYYTKENIGYNAIYDTPIFRTTNNK